MMIDEIMDDLDGRNAKFVQNFFGFYRFFRNSQKMKNDRKRGRIKGSMTLDRGLSNSKDADGGSRTHTGGYPTRF
ncbi:hypothetical protein DI43_15675 [Geobacillus sp. CAMR12739]|nr:hypothetical protein DI43_15675 [Geobacillus sp. CAMR12739]